MNVLLYINSEWNLTNINSAEFYRIFGRLQWALNTQCLIQRLIQTSPTLISVLYDLFDMPTLC